MKQLLKKFFVGLVQQEEKNDVLWTFDESYIIV